MKITLPGKSFIVLLILAVAIFSSCRTSRELPAERLKPVAAEKLIHLVNINSFDYSDLTIRRIQVQFSNATIKTSFRASLKALKNEGILASISKINIPVGRVLLTPESVTYVNYIDKNYFIDDYSFLSDYFNFSLNFQTIQSILSNRIFFTSQDSPDPLDQDFESLVENGRYVLQTAGRHNEIKTKGIFNRMRSSLYPGNLMENEREQGVIHKMYFNRRNYSLEKLLVDDGENGWQLEVDFKDFVKVEKKDYPGTIEIKMTSPGEVVELKIKLNGFTTDKINSIDLNIPGSYKQVYVD
jgi:hypothetical protein